jgi:hypothetical protein
VTRNKFGWTQLTRKEKQAENRKEVKKMLENKK